MIGKTTNAKVHSYEMYEFNRMKCTNYAKLEDTLTRKIGRGNPNLIGKFTQ